MYFIKLSAFTSLTENSNFSSTKLVGYNKTGQFKSMPRSLKLMKFYYIQYLICYSF